jgi:hypothetical protein
MLFVDDGGLSPQSSTLPIVASLVDGLVLGGDPRSTAGWADRLRGAVAPAGHLVGGISLMWATPPLAGSGDPLDAAMAGLAEEARQQRLAGAGAIIVRMAGLPPPEAVAEIAARLGGPVGR